MFRRTASSVISPIIIHPCEQQGMFTFPFLQSDDNPRPGIVTATSTPTNNINDIGTLTPLPPVATSSSAKRKSSAPPALGSLADAHGHPNYIQQSPASSTIGRASSAPMRSQVIGATHINYLPLISPVTSTGTTLHKPLVANAGANPNGHVPKQAFIPAGVTSPSVRLDLKRLLQLPTPSRDAVRDSLLELYTHRSFKDDVTPMGTADSQMSFESWQPRGEDASPLMTTDECLDSFPQPPTAVHHQRSISHTPTTNSTALGAVAATSGAGNRARWRRSWDLL
ncbi:hypothetical protein EV182_007257 [Spiromyces aspiralis]|uniref:Uncharacterized protein n=1 Tax=Spiromyces aspiralis TaxID=68401 RepID=A0ACC1HK15_9FUNG|nr:hypothetical protein EV182_007257 [Spiromyces aspiralis]